MNNLDELVKQLVVYLREGHDFVLSQAPDLVQQVLMWEKTKSWIGMIGMSALIVLLWVMGYFMRNTKNNDGTRDGSMDEMSYGLPAGLSCVFLSLFCMFLYDLIKIYVAPKVFLLGYFTSLVSK